MLLSQEIIIQSVKLDHEKTIIIKKAKKKKKKPPPQKKEQKQTKIKTHREGENIKH